MLHKEWWHYVLLFRLLPAGALFAFGQRVLFQYKREDYPPTGRKSC